MPVIGIGGQVAGRLRRRLGALLVTVAVAAGAGVAGAGTAGAAPAPPAAGTPYVYVVNQGTDTVSAYNAATGTITATIPVGAAPAGVAVSPDGRTAYVTNKSGNSVSVISTATGTVTATIPVGSDPFGIAVSPDGSHVYVANEVSNTVSVISTATGTVTATIPVGSGPFGVAVSPDGGTAYVTNVFDNTVSAISTATLTVTATLPVGTWPYDVAATTVPPASNKADVSVALACPAAMTTGSTGSCTLTVANAGPATAVSVNADILLPDQLKQQSCTPACGRLGNAVTWTLASLASGGSASLAVTVKATDRGSVTVAAAAVARSPDPNLRNNTAAAQVVITRAGH